MVYAVCEQVLSKQKNEIDQLKELEKVVIPDNFEYEDLPIRNEEVMILSRMRPKRMSDIMNLRDINPNSVLMVMRAVQKFKDSGNKVRKVDRKRSLY